MCGILIFQSNHLNNEIESNFKSSLNDLKNRGPDELKLIKNKNLLLGFTRLSINNLKTGSQPFISLCGKYQIVFNGEIVNYKNLVKELKRKNIKIKYGTEAEVIINLFILYGNKCVNYLRGFFAFVIIETKSSNIFAAVDRFSIKPLYYYQDKKKQLTIITSDFSTLIKNNIVKKELNLSKILDYFSLARDFDNLTIFQNIKKLKASTILKIKNNKITTFQYWHPFKKKINIKSYADANNLMNNKLFEITNLWKVAETKISLCLSSGVDSQLLNHFCNKNKINLTRFHIREGKIKFYNFEESIKINKDSKKIISLLNEFINNNHNPFPLAHSSSTSLFQLYNEIKSKKFKFTLNGEGLDELFGGYERYKRQLYLNRYKKLSLSESIMEVYKSEIENIKNNFKYNLIKNYKKILIDKIDSVVLHSKKIENKMLEFDQICWIPVLVQRHDSIGMNYGLEVRPPFLDHEFVDLVNSLPTHMKFNETKNKIFLRELLEKKLNYKISKVKIGTPSVFRGIMNNYIEINNFKETVFYGECQKFLNTKKVINKIKKNYATTDEIFLWRLYILNKIFYNF